MLLTVSRIKERKPMTINNPVANIVYRYRRFLWRKFYLRTVVRSKFIEYCL